MLGIELRAPCMQSGLELQLQALPSWDRVPPSCPGWSWTHSVINPEGSSFLILAWNSSLSRHFNVYSRLSFLCLRRFRRTARQQATSPDWYLGQRQARRVIPCSRDWLGHLIKWTFRKQTTKKKGVGREGSSMKNSTPLLLNQRIRALWKPLGHHLEALGFLSPCLSLEARPSCVSTSARW